MRSQMLISVKDVHCCFFKFMFWSVESPSLTWAVAVYM